MLFFSLHGVATKGLARPDLSIDTMSGAASDASVDASVDASAFVGFSLGLGSDIPVPLSAIPVMQRFPINNVSLFEAGARAWTQRPTA